MWCDSPCLSVWLSPGYLNKLLTDLNQILWNDRYSVKNQSIIFRNWSVSRPVYTMDFFIFSTWRTRAFLNIKYDYSEWMNVHEMFGRGRPSNKEHSIRFWDWSGSGSRISFYIFHALRDRAFLYIKYELKELRLNVYDVFWTGRPSNNEGRWRRFELYECFLVWVCHVVLCWSSNFTPVSWCD